MAYIFAVCIKTMECCVCNTSENVSIPPTCTHAVCSECLFTLIRSPLTNRCPVCRVSYELPAGDGGGLNRTERLTMMCSLLRRLEMLGAFEDENSRAVCLVYVLSLMV